MNDLIANLRAPVATKVPGGTVSLDTVTIERHMREAADEIERLTQERDLALANADAAYAKLMPEVERLRAALGWCVSELESYGCDEQGEYFESTVDALKTARCVLLNQQNGENK